MRSLGATSEDGAAPEQQWKTLRALVPYLWPADRPDLRIRVVVALVFLVLSKVFTVYLPFLYKAAVDTLNTDTAVREQLPAQIADAIGIVSVPIALIVAYGVSRVLMQIFGQGRDAIFAKVGNHAMRVVANETFRHMHALSLRFHLERRTGGLSRIIERGTKGIDFLLRFTLFSIFPTILEIFLVAAIFFYTFDAAFAATVMATVIAYVALTSMITEWRTRIRREMNDRDTEANTKAIDSLLNFETVKYFGNEEHESRRFDDAMAGYEKAAVKTQVSLAILNIGQFAVTTAGLTIVMLLAGSGVVAGSLTLGDFVLVNAMLIQMFQPLSLLGTVYREVKQSLVDMETMFALLDVPAEVRDAPGAIPLAVDGGEIAFRNVDFHYDPDRPILKDVSFTVPAGKTVAVVGPSGAGKSTISRLLYRFYDVSGGRVLIDGQDVRDVTQQSLRAAIGIVPQDTVLFNDTIAYNIRYGRPGATDEEVRAAARHAHIAPFVESLTKGYRSTVGERGLKLSGGEKQRVAIARTILKNPPILLLDEATSALDSKTEQDIQAELDEISTGRTTLMIAHRLSTVVHADEILVLERGRIVERGRHGDLLDLGGHYAEMWDRQQAASEARRKLAEVEDEAGIEAEATSPQSSDSVGKAAE